MPKKVSMQVSYPHEKVLAFVKERNPRIGWQKLGGDLSHIKKIQMTLTKSYNEH
jgi:hypothetical protein